MENGTSSNGGLTIRHILVVATGLLVCFGPAALTFNTWAIFVVPVCESLDVPTGAFTSYASLIFLFSATAAPFAGNLVQKHDVRIVFTAAAGLCAGGILACSFYTEVWQFYVSGAIEGVGVVVLVSLVAPTLISRWFHVHTGVLMGSCAAMMGVGGAVWSMLGGVLLVNFDWRACYLAFGIIAAVTSMPATLFFIRSYPSDVGLEPYGTPPVVAADSGEDAMQQGVSAQDAFRMPSFYLLMITIALVNGTAQMGNYLSKYIYHLSDIGALALPAAEVIMMASVIALCLQVSQACAKVGLGFVVDRTIKISLIISCACGFAGVMCAWQGVALAPTVSYLGAVLFGVFFGTTNVLGPSITRQLFGPREYTVIYSRIAILVNLLPAGFIPLYAFLADTSWDLLFGFATSMVVIIFISAMALVRFSKQ